MSREVRRVPLDWKHPVEHDTYAWTDRRPAPSRLLVSGQRFHALMGDFAGSVERWIDDLRSVVLRKGHHWTFNVEYHLTGWQDEDGTLKTFPVYGYDEDGERETETVARDEDHLFELLLAKVLEQRPTPEGYMPSFEGDDLGWCLYETVSEGTPTTPVFATADELIDHLATVGEDYDQKPYRREAAERLVHTGFSMGSMVLTGGVLYDGAKDIDRIPGGES